MQGSLSAMRTKMGVEARIGSGVGALERVPFWKANSPVEYWTVGILLGIAGVVSLWFFYSRNEILLSGDAVAHINIARRVFDSRTPGLLQLGSVWLPLPHLLTLPFVISGRMWQSGIGGSVVSVVSYVVAGLGLFRLVALWSRVAAWIGTLFFAANPNLLYVQTTALNEPLYLAAFVWSIVFFTQASRGLSRGQPAGTWLEKGAITLAAAILTRYDGWFLAAACWAAVLPGALKTMRYGDRLDDSQFRKSALRALLLTTLAPTLWLAYNFGVYQNPLEFANGPYSAKAIAQRTTPKDAAPYPGEGSPWTAGLYFTKAAQLNVGEDGTAKLLICIAVLASIVFSLRQEWLPFLWLWSPLVFYSLSIAFGSVPIFIPAWWPFSYYNVRYGLELLPAIAAGLGVSVFLATQYSRKATVWTVSLVVILTIGSHVGEWRGVPICLSEIRVNGQARLQLDQRMAALLQTLPHRSTVLAYTGAHSGAFELANFPLAGTINEGNYVIWDSALQHPAFAADYVIASDGDPVAAAVARNSVGLMPMLTIDVPGQPQTRFYRSARSKR